MDRIDQFNQQVKDGDLRSPAHERAFRLRRRLGEEPFPPWVERRNKLDDLTDYDPQVRK